MERCGPADSARSPRVPVRPSSLGRPARAVAAACGAPSPTAASRRRCASSRPTVRSRASPRASRRASARVRTPRSAIEGMTRVVSSSPSSRAGDDAPARDEIIADADDGLHADLSSPGYHLVARTAIRSPTTQSGGGTSNSSEKSDAWSGGMSHNYDFAFSLTYEAETHESGDDTATFSATAMCPPATTCSPPTTTRGRVLGELRRRNSRERRRDFVQIRHGSLLGELRQCVRRQRRVLRRYDTGAFSASYGGEIHESDVIVYDYDAGLLGELRRCVR